MAKRATDRSEDAGAPLSAADAPPRRARPPAINPDTPRSLAIARRGVSTGADFAELMSALVSDIIEEKIDANTANAVTNAGRQLLRVVELEYRYGGRVHGEPDEDGERSLKLIG